MDSGELGMSGEARLNGDASLEGVTSWAASLPIKQAQILENQIKSDHGQDFRTI